MEVAVLTGLLAEARIARRAGLAAASCGGNASRTLAQAEQFLAQGADALISFGIAGALAPGLVPGTLILPRAVVEESGARWEVDAGWHARLRAALARSGCAPSEGDVLGASQAIDSVAGKRAAFRHSGAVAVDLESHLVAQAASRAFRPFIILRAIADPAERSLPKAAVQGLDESGAPALRRVLLSVMKNPRQVPALLRIAMDTRRALAALRSALAQSVEILRSSES
jgi:adenosylhomocysteine nucleosidase